MPGGGTRTAARGSVLVLVLTALVLFPGGPGAGASCSGVTAVVDFGALGGGVQQRCVADGAGRPAWDVFEEAGFPLTPVQQFPGAVCRVSGKPASDPCVRMPPANAYWGLFWSTGSGWVYSTKGPQSLTVPAGGSLGFAWQNSTAQRKPGVTAASSSPTPAPSPKPTRSPTKKPAGSSGSVSTASPTVTATPSGSATPSPSARPTPSTSATPTPSASTTTPAAAAVSVPEATVPAEDSGGGGLAWWVPVLVLVVLAGGGGTVWWTRRRGTS